MKYNDNFEGRHINAVSKKAELLCKILTIFKGGEWRYGVEAFESSTLAIGLSNVWLPNYLGNSRQMAYIYKNDKCCANTGCDITSESVFARFGGFTWYTPDDLIFGITPGDLSNQIPKLYESGICRMKGLKYKQLVSSLKKEMIKKYKIIPDQVEGYELNDYTTFHLTDSRYCCRPSLLPCMKGSFEEKFLKYLNSVFVVTRYYVEVPNLIFVEFGNKPIQQILDEFNSEMDNLFSEFKEVMENEQA